MWLKFYQNIRVGWTSLVLSVRWVDAPRSNVVGSMLTWRLIHNSFFGTNIANLEQIRLQIRLVQNIHWQFYINHNKKQFLCVQHYSQACIHCPGFIAFLGTYAGQKLYTFWPFPQRSTSWKSGHISNKTIWKSCTSGRPKKPGSLGEPHTGQWNTISLLRDMGFNQISWLLLMQ